MSDESKSSANPPPFTAQDAMAFMQRMWNPFSMPMPGSTTGSVAPTPAETPPAAPQPAPGIAGMMPGMMSGMLPFPNPAAMFAALDPVEVERKIGELKIIEGWLEMSLNFMQMSIRTLELQKASLEALHATHAPAKSHAEAHSRKG